MKLLYILPVLIAIPLCSCSSNVCKGNGVPTVAAVKREYPDQPWYRCFADEHGKRMFMTALPVSYEFNHQIGHWKAYGAQDRKLYMTASGRSFRIEGGYVWDGATEGPTTARLLTPTLFHDAMLHAMMNGAPISQDQADGAFYQLMKKGNFFWSRLYYSAVRNFGTGYSQPQEPRTLRIVSTH